MSVARSVVRSVVRPVVFGSRPLLLDRYPDAATSLSLMLLSSQMRSSAIVRVRRSSDDEEVDVLADLSLGDPRVSLDSPLVGSAATYGDFISGTDGFVRTLYDQTGNERHAQQATALSQPKCAEAGALLTRNGMPSMTYDGSDDTMVFALPAFAPFAAAWAGVHRREDDVLGNRGFLGVAGTPTGHFIALISLAGTGLQQDFRTRIGAGTVRDLGLGFANAQDDYRAYVTGQTATQTYMRLHGESDTNGLSGSIAARSDWQLFGLGGNRMSGDLTTAIFWDSDIAANAQLEQDMAALHNITLPS